MMDDLYEGEWLLVMTRHGTDPAQNINIKSGLTVRETYLTSTYTDNFNGKMAFFAAVPI